MTTSEHAGVQGPWILAILVVALLFCLPRAGFGNGGPVQEGAVLQKHAGGFEFTEGATCDPHGNVFFVDQPNNRIHRWDVEKGELSTFLEPAGRANGMCFDASGRLIACADETNALWSIAADRQIAVLAFEYEGRRLNAPNDVWVHPTGSLYFTDPFYKRAWWSHTEMPQDGQHVYHLSADRKKLSRVTHDLRKPNGITGTPDGKTLYVADLGANRTYAYDIQADGTLDHRRLFCEAGSDGMTLDDEGNLFTTSKGVLVFDKTGRLVTTIEVPEPWTANVCFGGNDRRTLFITASKGLYSVRMRTRGANPGK